jgi:hypothetical protein
MPILQALQTVIRMLTVCTYRRHVAAREEGGVGVKTEENCLLPEGVRIDQRSHPVNLCTVLRELWSHRAEELLAVPEGSSEGGS